MSENDDIPLVDEPDSDDLEIETCAYCELPQDECECTNEEEVLDDS